MHSVRWYFCQVPLIICTFLCNISKHIKLIFICIIIMFSHIIKHLLIKSITNACRNNPYITQGLTSYIIFHPSLHILPHHSAQNTKKYYLHTYLLYIIGVPRISWLKSSFRSYGTHTHTWGSSPHGTTSSHVGILDLYIYFIHLTQGK